MTIQQTKYAGPKEFIALMAILMSVVAISIDAMLPALRGAITKKHEMVLKRQQEDISRLN